MPQISETQKEFKISRQTMLAAPRRLLVSGLAALLCLAFSAAVAKAHPHVWISMNATLQFDKAGRITGIYEEWRFDKDYSKIAVEGLDVDKDGYLSPEELEPLSAENIKALKEYSYFTYLRINGKKTELATVKEYGQYFANGILTMTFTAPLKTPIDPRTKNVNLKIYDPTFFIAMDFQKKEPIAASGNLPKTCKLKLKPVATDEEIEKTRKELSAKDKNWQPDANEDFGALFAQPLVVLCSDNKAS